MRRRTILGAVAALAITASFFGCGDDEPDSRPGTSGPGASVGASATSGGDTGTGSTSGGDPASPCAVGRVLSVSDGPATSPATAWGGDRFAVAYEREGGIRIALVDASGERTSDEAVSLPGSSASLPQVAPLDAGGFVVVWQRVLGGATTVSARRVDAAGKPQGAEWALGASSGAEARPSVAMSTEGLAVAWMDGANVVVGFGNVGGAPTKKTPIDAAAYPALAAATTGLGVAYSTGNRIALARLTAAGGAPALMGTMGSGAAKRTLPDLAWTGDGFVLAWEDWTGGESHEAIHAAKVASDGKVTGDVQVHAVEGSANWPSIAWIGQHAAIAYYQFRDGPPAVYLTLMDASMARVGDDLEVSEGSAKYPSLAWSGSALGIAWAETTGLVRMSMVTCSP